MKKTVILILNVLLILSCDFFKMRDSETPSDGNVLLPRTEPENLLANLKTIYENQDIGGLDDQFSDDFLFYPDPFDLELFPSVSASSWNFDKEKNITERLFVSYLTSENDVEAVFELTSDNDVIQEETAFLYREYQVSISGGSSPKEYYGKLILTLSKDNFGLWEIESWEDFRVNPSKTSWGYWKCYYY